MNLSFLNGQFTEEQLEKAIIELLVEQGYSYVCGDTLHRRLEDVLIEDDLRAYLKKKYANEFLTESEIGKIISRIKLIPSEPLYQGNREAFWLINEGFDFQRDDPTKLALHVNYIDFENTSNNSYKVVNQLSIQGSRLRRPDLLLFINGIPVAIFEFVNDKMKIHKN